jgi:hypothetical protein
MVSVGTVDVVVGAVLDDAGGVVVVLDDVVAVLELVLELLVDVDPPDD